MCVYLHARKNTRAPCEPPAGAKVAKNKRARETAHRATATNTNTHRTTKHTSRERQRHHSSSSSSSKRICTFAVVMCGVVVANVCTSIGRARDFMCSVMCRQGIEMQLRNRNLASRCVCSPRSGRAEFNQKRIMTVERERGSCATTPSRRLRRDY